MADFAARPVLITDMVMVWDVICPGAQRHISAEERVTATHLAYHQTPREFQRTAQVR